MLKHIEKLAGCNIPIFYINLRRRPDRNQHFLSLFKGANVSPTRIEAYDGLDPEAMGILHGPIPDYVPIKRPQLVRVSDQTMLHKLYCQIGCVCSHLKAIKTWLQSDAQIGIFCEDDLSTKTLQYWNYDINGIISRLPADWDCVQLCTSNYQMYQQLLNHKNNNVLTIPKQMKLSKWHQNNWCTGCYILNRSYGHFLIDKLEVNGRFDLSQVEGSRIQADDLLYRLGKTYTINLMTFEHFESNLDGLWPQIDGCLEAVDWWWEKVGIFCSLDDLL